MVNSPRYKQTWSKAQVELIIEDLFSNSESPCRLNTSHQVLAQSGVLLMYTLEGVSSVANFIAAYEESQ